jgi:hypothetical protein
MHVPQAFPECYAGVIEHLLPNNMTPGDVELSIVIPAMNEEVHCGIRGVTRDPLDRINITLGG